MKAFVAGATGETGRRIVSQLLEAEITVKALVRDRAKAAQLLPSEVELVEADLNDVERLSQLMADCSVVLCALGSRPSFDPTGPYQVDYVGTTNLVKASQKTDIQQFVLVSSLCVSKLFHPLNLFWLILVWKQKAEQYLQNSGIPYTIVRPGGLKSEDIDLPIVMAGADQLFDGSIPRLQVARVCVAALNEAAAQNKICEIIASPDTPNQSMTELFAQVSPA